MKQFLFCLVAVAVLIVIAQLAHNYPMPIFIIWAATPLIAWFLASDHAKGLLSAKGSRTAGVALGCLAVLLSLFFFANFDRYRDSLGQEHIAGYTVTYGTEFDDFGRPHRDAEVRADSLIGRFLLWGGEVLFLGLVIGVSVLTWKSSLKLLERNDDEAKGH